MCYKLRPWAFPNRKYVFGYIDSQGLIPAKTGNRIITMCVDYDKHLVILVSFSLTLDEKRWLVSSKLIKNSKLCEGESFIYGRSQSMRVESNILLHMLMLCVLRSSMLHHQYSIAREFFKITHLFDQFNFIKSIQSSRLCLCFSCLCSY